MIDIRAGEILRYPPNRPPPLRMTADAEVSFRGVSETIKEAAATYDDLLKLPEHVVGEIVAGELWASPRPAARHARTSSLLGSEIIGPFDRGRGGPGGWWILFEPELHLGNDV